MLDSWGKELIENAIQSAGLPLSSDQFEDLVRKAAKRDPAACAQLRDVAQAIYPRMPKARGKSLSTATATHAVLLAYLGERSYTYSNDEEDFVDPMTRATRRHFEQRRFHPGKAVELRKNFRLIGC